MHHLILQYSHKIDLRVCFFVKATRVIKEGFTAIVLMYKENDRKIMIKQK